MKKNIPGENNSQRHVVSFTVKWWILSRFLCEKGTGNRIKLMKDGKLLISNAGHRDIGSYQCHVEGLTSRSARLRFYQGRAKPTILHR